MNTVISKDGTKIAYDKLGEGPRLIYVLGALCYRQFEPAVADVHTFSKEFTVINYDRRGRGDSTDTLPYSVDREVEDIEALIDANGGSAYLYGHSSGASLALEAALRLDKKVLKLAMYEPPYNNSDEDQKGSVAYDKELKELLDVGKRGEAVEHFMKLVGMPDEMINGVKQSPSWSTLESLAPTLAYDSAVSSYIVPTQKASQIDMPALVMYGEESYGFMKLVAESLAKAFPHGQLHAFPGQGHNASSELVLPVLTDFFNKS